MEKKYSVAGMSCAACSAAVERALSSLDVVLKAEVNLLANTVTITLPESAFDEALLYDTVKKAGYTLLPYAPPQKKKESRRPSFLSLISHTSATPKAINLFASASHTSTSHGSTKMCVGLVIFTLILTMLAS